MAWYVEEADLIKADGTESVWKIDYNPGDTVPVSGIYKCRLCKKEVTSNQGDPLPPQNHHQHPQRGPVKWRLIIWTNTTGD